MYQNPYRRVNDYRPSTKREGQAAREEAATTSAAVFAAPGVSVAELEGRIRSPERKNADLREQRTILKRLSPSYPNPAMKMDAIKSLAGEHGVRKLCRTLGVARSSFYAAQKKVERPRAKADAWLGTRARELFETSAAPG